MSPRLASRILLLGWDGADWKIIQALLDAGRMPNLERLINEGVMGNLATLQPILSPMLWTSIATGKRADRHGVHGFIEPRLDGRGIHPVQSSSLCAQPLWSILSRQGLKSAVVGWYATHPADGVGGIVVSNFFSHPAGQDFDHWPLPPNSVAPESLRDILIELRVHPTDVDAEQLLYFVPMAAQVDQGQDRRLAVLARMLAHCATIHVAGTHLAEHESWDLLAVYYEAIDRLCHEFMPYRPPKMDEVSEEEFELYRDVIDRCYRFHDLMLGRYMGLVSPETTIVIVSDHGFYSDHLRPRPRGRAAWGQPVLWHRPYGIFVARGPGIKQDQLVFGASLLDIAPTVLTMLGLPVGRDMEGRVLTQIFADPPVLEFVDTYETADGREHPSRDAEDDDPWAAQEALKQLVALGYVEPPAEDAARAVEQATAQKLFNLAEVHISKAEWDRAAPLLEDLHRRRPTHTLATLRLAQCRLHLGDVDACRALVDEVFAGKPDSPWGHLAYGLIHFAQGEWDQALARFQKAEDGAPNLPDLHYRTGLVYLRQQRWAEAEAAFRKALEIDGDRPHAYDGLGVALYRQGRYEEATEHLMRSIGLPLPSAGGPLPPGGSPGGGGLSRRGDPEPPRRPRIPACPSGRARASRRDLSRQGGRGPGRAPPEPGPAPQEPRARDEWLRASWPS